MTRNRRERADESTPMRDVSHTNPYTNESMGSVFEHGVTIVADGGERGAVDDADAEERSTTDDADAEEHSTTDDADAEERSTTDDADPEADAHEAAESADGTPMRDVSHEAPEGGHGNRMFERVGKPADVVDEE